MNTHVRTPKAFTLVELLIVIAIISLLAAILFPVFTRARENARRTSCMGNLRQLGLGIMQYTQDYDEYMPLRQITLIGKDGVNTTSWSWRYLVYPYIKSTQIFTCPSNPLRTSNVNTDGSGANAWPGTPTFNVSYACNGGSTGPMGDLHNTPPYLARKLAVLASPSTLLLVGESLKNHAYLRNDVDPIGPDEAGYSSTSALMFGGHLSTANMIFADGHAKTLKWSVTCRPPYSWNNDGSACSTTIINRMNKLDTIYD